MANKVTTGSLHSRGTDIRPIAVSGQRIDHRREMSTDRKGTYLAWIENSIETDAALTLAEEHR